jgi:SagB-type dehydrogenase family enzyme
LWSLRDDVSVESESGGGPVRLRGRWGEVVIERPSRLVREALGRMRLGPISLENVINGRQADSATAARLRAELHGVFDQLQHLIIRSLRLETGQPLLSVVPVTVQSRFRPEPLAADIPIRISAYAWLRTDRNVYYLESPLALHRVVLHRAEAVTLIASLASPVTPAALTASLASVGEVADDALAYLAAAGMVIQAESTAGLQAFAEDIDPALSGWSPADLLFHASSTLGRHDHNFGRIDPPGETMPPEPVVKPQADRYIQLHRPRWEDLGRADLSLTAAIEGRRSVRRHGARPVTLTELGDLLYRTARVRSLITIREEGGGAAGEPEHSYELSSRPYPGGGACYETELYATVRECAGLEPGVYHYDPLGHRLEPVSGDQAARNELLGLARVAAGMEEPPQVLLSMTARFRRVTWRYEGLAYRLAVMHVGVLMQTLYLVCTAMRLAPCALGTVSITAAARAFGTDWRAEPCVGQFVVGREPEASGSAASGGRPPALPDTADQGSGPWRKVNDPEWVTLARRR